jgi:hypothetical protein
LHSNAFEFHKTQVEFALRTLAEFRGNEWRGDCELGGSVGTMYGPRPTDTTSKKEQAALKDQKGRRES